MKIWEIGNKPGCLEITGKVYRRKFLGDGKYQYDYDPIEVETMNRKASKKDAVYFHPAVPIVNQRAKELLEPILGNQVQWCELIYERKLWAINVTNVIDCLDKERAEYNYRSDGGIGYISKLVLLPELITESTLIFRIPERVGTDVFVTEAFINFVNENKITGFKFTEAWDSEFDEEKEQAARKPYEDKIKEINNNLDENLDWPTISEQFKQGKAFISDRFKVQFNTEGVFMLGHLQLDLTYEWGVPIYLPPPLLYYKWSEVEPEQL